jgi:hypothetical protein
MKLRKPVHLVLYSYCILFSFLSSIYFFDSMGFELGTLSLLDRSATNLSYGPQPILLLVRVFHFLPRWA